ncbi:MAG: hypothetical protein ACYCSN_01845 [Acidobacteriaceae bacterium]
MKGNLGKNDLTDDLTDEEREDARRPGQPSAPASVENGQLDIGPGRRKNPSGITGKHLRCAGLSLLSLLCVVALISQWEGCSP